MFPPLGLVNLVKAWNVVFTGKPPFVAFCLSASQLTGQLIFQARSFPDILGIRIDKEILQFSDHQFENQQKWIANNMRVESDDGELVSWNGKRFETFISREFLLTQHTYTRSIYFNVKIMEWGFPKMVVPPNHPF